MQGLSFTNPAMLHALWAAALPILIHLLNRRRSVTVSFSNVALLQTLQQDRMRKVKIKQWVLLALRTLLIAALVLAFARPTIRDASFGRGHGETTAVMLVDRSLSMEHESDGKSLLRHGKERVDELTALFQPEDDVVLFPYDDRILATNETGLERVRLTARSIEASFRGSNPVPAIDAARRVLRSSDSINRELYVLSDLFAAGWSQVRDTYDGFEGTSVFVVRPPEPDRQNVAVRSIRPEGLLLSVGQPARLLVDVENVGSEVADTVPVQVFADERRIGQKVVSLDAGERKRVAFRYTPDRAGARVFSAEIPEDGFVADNRRSTVVHIPEAIRIGIVGSGGDVYYLSEALQSGPGLELTQVKPGTAGTDAYDSLDLIILANAKRLGRGEISAIRDRVARGAGLLLLMGAGLDVRLYNEQILPVLCPASITGVSSGRGERERFLTLEASGVDHPTLTGLLGDKLPSPKFYMSYNVQAGDGDVILRYSSGNPAMLAHQVGRGRVIAMTSHTDLDWSDLSLTGFFAPFLQRAVRYLATGAYGADEVTVGKRVARPVNRLGAREATVQPPSGATPKTVWAQQLGGRPHWVIDEVDVPGIWQIHAGERVVDRFAVQVDDRESDTAVIEDDRLKALFPGADVVFVEPDQTIASVVSDYRYGAELWRYFLVMALLCLAAELALMAGENRARD